MVADHVHTKLLASMRVLVVAIAERDAMRFQAWRDAEGFHMLALYLAAVMTAASCARSLSAR